MRDKQADRRMARFYRDTRGTIAMMYGCSIFFLCGIVGLAVDASRAYGIASRTQSILDTASLAAARMLDAPGSTDDDVHTKAAAFITGHLAQHKDITARFENLRIVPLRGSQTVSVAIDVVVPTIFAGLLGFSEFRFQRDSIVIYKLRGIELSMVLDITGSMCSDWGTPAGSVCLAEPKLQALRASAKTIVKKLLDVSPGEINTNRVALAPFSASVNVGSFQSQVASGPSFAKDDCVIERPGAASTTDDPISASTRANVISTPGFGMPNAPSGARYSCPVSPILPLTNDAAKLNTEIDGLRPWGGTAGHIGMAWGWNLVSPNFGNIFTGVSTPAAYTDISVIKSVLLMTDGVFNNSYKTSDASSVAAQEAESTAAFAEICTNMKKKGVIVYTIGFGLSEEVEPKRSQVKALLETCASEPANFFDTETDVQLLSAFTTIAEQLTALRVTG
jgi:hypothetical protein